MQLRKTSATPRIFRNYPQTLFSTTRTASSLVTFLYRPLCAVRKEMKAMVLNELCGLEENQAPLELPELPDPIPSENEILIRISACGVCHTELDEIEG
jgi:hypothetical protein